MITILFATYNGADTLPKMLDAFCALITPDDGWKIVAVDNGSNDNTASIIKSYEKVLPITYIFEASPGKNNALNKGLEYIEGDLVILTDDDILPDKNWLFKLNEYSLTRPEYDIFAGKIIPEWPYQPDPALLKSIPLSVAFALTTDTYNSKPISPGEVFGPNMAVRKKIFDLGVKFDGKIGPQGSNYPMGSETEFTTRVFNEMNAQCFFCHDATVKHIIHPHQLSHQWIFGRAFRCGRGNYMLENKTKEHPPIMRKWIYLLTIKLRIKSLFYRIIKNEQKFLSESWKYNYYKGYIYQGFLVNFKSPTPL